MVEQLESLQPRLSGFLRSLLNRAVDFGLHTAAHLATSRSSPKSEVSCPACTCHATTCPESPSCPSFNCPSIPVTVCSIPAGLYLSVNEGFLLVMVFCILCLVSFGCGVVLGRKGGRARFREEDFTGPTVPSGASTPTVQKGLGRGLGAGPLRIV